MTPLEKTLSETVSTLRGFLADTAVELKDQKQHGLADLMQRHIAIADRALDAINRPQHDHNQKLAALSRDRIEIERGITVGRGLGRER